MACRAAVVHRSGGHDRRVLGRLRRSADGRAPSACAARRGGHPRQRGPLRRRRPLHRRMRVGDGHEPVGDVNAGLPEPAAGPGGGRRNVARGVAGAVGERPGVHRAVAQPPAARRLLAAGITLRGLRLDPLPGLRGRRLERRLPGHGPASGRAREGPGPGPDRSVGPHVAGGGEAGPGHRVPAGVPAVLRRQPEWRRQRLLRGATADQLHAGGGPAGWLLHRAARAVGSRPVLAVPVYQRLDAHDRGYGARRRRQRGGQDHQQPAVDRSRRRSVVRRRQPGRLRARPALRGRQLAVLGHRAAVRAGRDPGQGRGPPGGERGQALGACGGARV